MNDGLCLLIAEGNPSDRNEALKALGGRTGSECFTALLEELAPGCHIEVAMPADIDAALPAGHELGAYDGIMISGSGLNIPGGEDDPRVQRQIEFARAGFEAGVPMFGSCWGLQVAAAAAGGLVKPHPRGSEMAIARKISLNDAGRGHPMFEGKSGVFDQPAIHVDEVTHLPSGATLLASNSFCTVQAASIAFQGGMFWGVQYHPEFDLLDMAKLVRRYATRLVDQGFFADTDAAEDHAGRLSVLDAAPERQDLAWLLGIDDDILDRRIRWREIENWINRLVRPAARR